MCIHSHHRCGPLVVIPVSMSILFIKKLITFLFPMNTDKTFLEPFMKPNGKYFEFSDESYTVQARIKVIKK